MPNVPALPTPNTRRIGDALRRWMFKEHKNQTAAGQALDVSQSTISRAVRGLVHEGEPVLNKICEGIGTTLWLESVDPDAARAIDQLPPPLAAALRRVWDGSPASTERVAQLLEAVATLHDAAGTTGVVGGSGTDAGEESGGDR